MRYCQLAYRLKNAQQIQSVLFESFEEAQNFLTNNGLQVVVGKPNVPNAHVLYEKAAETSKADWHEFSHVEVA